ncbi:hypothetical protein I313_06384 [Cryptococcus deuterogattii Ram5]|uniref:Unplaced genomic scaffold supercont1.19, whole genome shotgun sequence n=1 Tax=Cryptococcus deuterogattii Ram5 TaxID=1296110 RepID=A0A0D0UY42_9TREE|nr:hypothetical protein I313_06384 [Cryptococcus deuterogattii Ram5]
MVKLSIGTQTPLSFNTNLDEDSGTTT